MQASSDRRIIFPIIACAFLLSFVACQTQSNDTEQSTGTYTDVTVKSTTPVPVSNASCETHNDDCKGCVSSSKCFFCETDNRCRAKITKVLTNDDCDLKKIHYLTCRVNFQYLMIGIGVFAGIAVLIIAIFCCYCCCKKKGIKISKDDIKWARQREERKQIAAEKRKERAERIEDIRKKYNLGKSGNNYERFDA